MSAELLPTGKTYVRMERSENLEKKITGTDVDAVLELVDSTVRPYLCLLAMQKGLKNPLLRAIVDPEECLSKSIHVTFEIVENPVASV